MRPGLSFLSLQFCGILFLTMFGFDAGAQQRTVGLLFDKKSSPGYVLFAPLFSKKTFLIDKNGRRVNEWTSRYNPGQSAYLLPGGKLLRTGNDSSAHFYGGGGVIQRFSWKGELEWEYRISDSLQRQHHDICPLPSGNILVLVWEKRARSEALVLGRDPDKTGKSIWSEKIVEIRPIGKNAAEVVWTWRVWDHLIQDRNKAAPNFGEIDLNPGKLDINYGATISEDWLHFNSLAYHPEFDQIMISNRNLNEIYVIDHCTSAQEAATALGGRYGRGGDFLYRWGNPETFKNGAKRDQQLYRQHHAHWIEKGLPDEGKLMVFNNGPERGNEEYSEVMVVELPQLKDGSFGTGWTSGMAPVIWRYEDRERFYSYNVSSAQRLRNGNTLICEGAEGRIFEIDREKKNVWEYVNPVTDTGPLEQGKTSDRNIVFRAVFYYPTSPELKGIKIKRGLVLENR